VNAIDPAWFAALAAMLLAAFAARQDLQLKLRNGIPAMAAMTIAMTALFALTPIALTPIFPHQAAWFAALALCCGLIVEIDRRHHLIPDLLVLALAGLALTAPFAAAPFEELTGALLLGGLFLAVRAGFAHAGQGEALGLGDVKLALVMGALLGPQYGLLAVACAGAATLVIAAPRAMRGGASTLGAGAPFGVGLAAALALTAGLRLWGGT
jgi:leader peptidase (prepilin peptidase) / N-methyltransferase